MSELNWNLSQKILIYTSSKKTENSHSELSKRKSQVPTDRFALSTKRPGKNALINTQMVTRSYMKSEKGKRLKTVGNASCKSAECWINAKMDIHVSEIKTSKMKSLLYETPRRQQSVFVFTLSFFFLYFHLPNDRLIGFVWFKKKLSGRLPYESVSSYFLTLVAKQKRNHYLRFLGLKLDRNISRKLFWAWKSATNRISSCFAYICEHCQMHELAVPPLAQSSMAQRRLII